MNSCRAVSAISRSLNWIFHRQSITDSLEMGWREKKPPAFYSRFTIPLPVSLSLSLSLSRHSLHLSQIHSALFPIRLSPTVLSFPSPIHIPSISSEPFITQQQKLLYFCLNVQRGHHVIVFLIHLLDILCKCWIIDKSVKYSFTYCFHVKMEIQVFIDWGWNINDLCCQCWPYLMFSPTNWRQRNSPGNVPTHHPVILYL